MDIKQATQGYEVWLQNRITLIPADLELKHQRMAQSPLLTLTMIAEAAHGWTIQDYYLDDHKTVPVVFVGKVRGQAVKRLLMFVGMTAGGYIGCWAGEYVGFGLMGTFLVSSLGSMVGIYATWRITRDYLD